MNTLLAPFAQPSAATALILPSSGTALSYDRLAQLIRQLTADLNAWDGNGTPLALGDTVSMSLINSVEFAVAFLGVGNHRCVAAPLNPAYNKDEVAFYLSDCKSKLVIVPAGASTASPLHPAVVAARELGVQIAEIGFDGRSVSFKFLSGAPKRGAVGIAGSGSPRPTDVALVLHTSGTTGRPKAVPLTHLNLATTMKNVIDTYRLTAVDRAYLVMPLFHVHGLLSSFLAPLLSGGSVVVPTKFSAGTFWSDFVQYKCTWYSAVPTIHQILLRTPFPSPMPTIRFIRSCSSALAPATHAELERTFRAPVLEAYAMTEAAHQMTSNPLPPLARKPGTVGLGQGVAIRILAIDSDDEVEEGEVAIKGLNVTPGYLNNDKANAESFTKVDRYFRTGDRGKLDKDGYLVLTGRLKELINRGGEKISPLEVDGALLSLGDVGEAVAFGVPDEMMGEKVWAVVVLKSGASTVEAKLIQEIKTKISAFKCPERIFMVDAIPKTATGKIQRKAIATRFVKEVADGLHPRAKL